MILLDVFMLITQQGTWLSMSIALLKDPKKPHRLLDDFEALFWSLLYGSIKYYRHESDHLPSNIFYESYTETLEDGTNAQVGGDEKYFLLESFGTTLTFASRPLNTLLGNMARLWRDYYHLCFILKPSDFRATYRDSTSDTKEAQPNVKEDLGEDVSDKDTTKDPRIIRQRLDKLREKVSRPSTWLKLFENAIDQAGWESDDKMAKNCIDEPLELEPIKNALAKLQILLVGPEVDTTRELESTDVLSQKENVKADYNSCVHEDFTTENDTDVGAECQPTIAPSAALSKSSPPPRPPLSPITMHFGSPTRLKRTLAEMSPTSPNSNNTDAIPAPRSKKSRTTNLKSESTNRMTRSSSRKAVVAHPPEVACSKPGKETRAHTRRHTPRKIRIEDEGAGHPRREGLRPRRAIKYTA